MNTKKKILIIAIISAIVISALIFFNKDEQPIPNISARNNKILNRSTIMGADMIVAAGLMELDIDSIYVLISHIHNISKDGLEYKAYIVSLAPKVYNIKIRSLSTRNAIDVLAHELIHLKQMHTNVLFNDKSTIYWGIMMYEVDNLPDYFSRPWEIQAFEEQVELSKGIRNLIYK
jgi:hypothetical protein